MEPFALIIEDNADHAFLFADALQAAGFVTEIVVDGDAALERLAATTPALVVLDLRMPLVPGKDVLRHIRSDAQLTEVCVILATGDHLTAERLRGEADVVLIKPIDFDQLRDLAISLRPSGATS
jgi:DNA-binding response OmpR family regulator